MSTQFWTVSDTLRVDTDAVLRANLFLQQCDDVLSASQLLVRGVIEDLTYLCPLGVDPYRVALGLEARNVTEQALSMISAVLEKTRELIHWRERAVQIYAQAESRVFTYATACLEATIAKCGYTPGWSPLALPLYLLTMSKHYAGRGNEGLRARNYVNVASTLPFTHFLTIGYALKSGGRINGIAKFGSELGVAMPWSKPGVFVNSPTTLAYTEKGVIKWTLPGISALMTGPFTQAAPPTRRIKPPLTIAGALHGLSDSDPGGGFRILKHEGPHGRSWSVIIPGTKTWVLNGANVQNLRTNLEEISGEVSDQRYAVEVGMEMAGIKPGEPVEIVGHSQGGIVAGNMATDPAFTSKYAVVSVLTAGSPLSKIPKLHPNSLALENLSDIVPATGGGHNNGGTTVYFDKEVAVAGGRQAGATGPHSIETYESAAQSLETSNDPGVIEAQKWAADRLNALHLNSETATTVLDFQTHRGSS